MVWKLLRKNISPVQIAGYALANLIGLAIIIGAVKFYTDISSTWHDEDSFFKKDYLIISKQVSTLQTAGVNADATEFFPDEIESLKQQPWVKKVGSFSSANFNVNMSMEIGGRGMSTYLFFEAIPDEFLDIAPQDWAFDPEHPMIPIILSKDYLTLYNFGFATTRGMPQLSEAVMSTLPINMTLTGNGFSETYPARIVGFSSRLNTVAVPQQFLDWANERYSSGEALNPSRLVVEVSSVGDPAINKYFDKYGYEVAGDKNDNSQAAYFLTVITTIVLAVGAIITILAFFILMLSIYLLLQKNRQKLHDLMLLGYTPFGVARSYYVLIGVINLSVLVLAIVMALWASSWWAPRLNDIGIESSSPLTAILVGVAIILVITLVNILSIRRIVHRNFFD